MRDQAIQHTIIERIAHAPIHKYITPIIAILEYRQMAALKGLSYDMNSDARNQVEEIIADCDRRIKEVLLIQNHDTTSQP